MVIRSIPDNDTTWGPDLRTMIAEHNGLTVDGLTKSSIRTVLCIGDSMTQGNQTGDGYAWPNLFATAVGEHVTAVNRGQGGFTSTEIAISYGAVNPAVGAFTIPADTSATAVTVTAPTGAFRTPVTGGATFSYLGVLAGVPGTLTRSPTADTWTFARTTAGSATPVAAGATFHATRDDAHTDKVAVIWVGRNNIATSASPIVQSDIAAMVARMSPSIKRYLVMGVCPSLAETTGSQGHTNILALNSALATTYGDRYVDLRTLLMASGLSLNRITPTSQDSTAISNGTIPPSLLADPFGADNLHFNRYGYAAVAKFVVDRMAALGWLPEEPRAVYGTGLENLRTSPSFIGTATVNAGADPSTNVTATRTAGVGRDNSYGVRYTFGATVTGPAFTLYQEGLDGATAYSGSLWVRPSKPVTLAPRILRWNTAFASFATGQYDGAGVLCLPGAWTKLSLEGTVTGGTIFAICAANDSQQWLTADYLDVDDVTIVAGTVEL